MTPHRERIVRIHREQALAILEEQCGKQSPELLSKMFAEIDAILVNLPAGVDVFAASLSDEDLTSFVRKHVLKGMAV